MRTGRNARGSKCPHTTIRQGEGRQECHSSRRQIHPVRCCMGNTNRGPSTERDVSGARRSGLPEREARKTGPFFLIRWPRRDAGCDGTRIESAIMRRTECKPLPVVTNNSSAVIRCGSRGRFREHYHESKNPIRKDSRNHRGGNRSRWMQLILVLEDPAQSRTRKSGDTFRVLSADTR